MLGSILITAATMLGAFAIVKSSEYGIGSARTLGIGAASLALLAGFLALESRIANPIMPLRVLRLRMLMGSSLVRGMLVTGMFSAFFLGSLFLERVLGYNAIQTGLAFMPLTLSIAAMSLGGSSRLVNRFGAVPTLAGGLATIIAGLAVLATQGIGASYFPGLFVALHADGPRRGRFVSAAADDRHVRRAASRCRAGVRDRQRLGTAVRRDRPRYARHYRDGPHEGARPQGEGTLAALTGGYHLAYVVAAVFVAVGILAALLVLRTPSLPVVQETDEELERIETIQAGEPVAQAA